MLEEKDLQAISALLKENNKTLKDEIVGDLDEKIAEVLIAVNETSASLETRLDSLEAKTDDLGDEMAKRPTKDEVFSWADRRIVDLEISVDEFKYLHPEELNKLPPRNEISRVLVERGFKQKLA